MPVAVMLYGVRRGFGGIAVFGTATQNARMVKKLGGP
jgi:hypothetical protein